MEDSKVAVILEDLRSQFKVFGEGLNLLNDKFEGLNDKYESLNAKLDAHIEENRREFALNRLEHQQMMQMIKEVDSQVQVELKRVK